MVMVLRDVVLLITSLAVGTQSSTQESRLRPMHDIFHHPHAKNLSFENCGPQDPSFDVSVSPNDLKPRQPYNITVTLTPTKDILSVACGYKVLFKGLLFLTSYEPNSCGKDWIRCPLLKGVTYTFSQSQNRLNMKMSIPQGQYNAHFQCKDQDDDYLVCFTAAAYWVF